MIIAFDLDGTLIDSARDLADAIGEMLESYGSPALPLDTVITMVGEGAPVLVARAVQRSGLSAPVEEALSRFLSIYDRRLMNHTRAYPGMIETLGIVVRRGPLAVLTNKPLGPSIGLLEALGMRGYFSRVIGGDSEYGRKPDPAGLLSLQALAPGDQLLMIGDSPADWKAAVHAGVPFVFAKYGFGASKFGSEPPDTDLVIEHPRELDRVLDRVGRA